MKTTLWVQIVKTFLQEETIEGETVKVEKTQIEEYAYDGDTWEKAFTDASSAYFNKAWYLTADVTVSWFKIQIVNKLMAVEKGMTAEWTRPVAPTSEPEDDAESEG